MATSTWERQRQKVCPKGPSFSSSLLDTIYRSIDETRGANEHHQPQDTHVNRRNNAAQAEEDIESLRRAIMIEKWIESHTSSACKSTPHHLPSNSASSTDSSLFSSSETESPQPQKQRLAQKPPNKTLQQLDTKWEGKFTKTKSKALKIYGELKKVKEPISPGGKISNFLNSIFSPRNLKSSQGVEEWSSMRKSKSMKDTSTSSMASRSCLSKNASSRGSKSKRSVRFCPVSVILDEHKTIYNHDSTISPPDFIKKNTDSFRDYEVRDCHQEDKDLDGLSCASSDLFELENIGRVEYEEELPVYETTSLERNQSIAGVLVTM